MKTNIPSPSRSQGAHTPRRKSRRTLSVGSPALSTASGRLSSVVQGFVNKQMNSFALSPLPKRRSVLTDNTDIMEEPRRQSWWKKLNENSRNVLEILEDNNLAEPNNIMEELDIEILSQEKKNYTLDIPESSDGESIHSIVLPQKKLFTQKETQHQKKFDQIIGTRETMAKSNENMTINDKVINAGRKELFQNKPRSKLLFPAALLDITPDKTIADKTKEFAAESKTQPRNIFGNRQGAKRKNMFADFIATESDDEIPEIQPRVFGFPKKPELARRGSSASRGIRESSPTSNVTTDTEMDEWRLLPSSTMVEHQLEAMMEQNTPKKPRLSKLTETKESSGINTVFSKSKSPEVNTSVLTRSRLRALSNSGTSTSSIGKNKTYEKIYQNQSQKNDQHDKSRINKSRSKINESNKNLEHHEDQNLRVADASQEKMSKSLQKKNVSLVIGSEQNKDQSREVVDGMQTINVALEAIQSHGQIVEEQKQQKVIAESQEVDESEEFNVSQKIDENYEVEDVDQEEDNYANKNEESDKEELEESQDPINESQEQDVDNEEQANESQEHFDQSIEQEGEGQAANQSRAENDEIKEATNHSQVDGNDGENDEEISQNIDNINESNEANERNEIADQSQEEVNESDQVVDESNETQEEVDESNVKQNEMQSATEDDENEANEHDENSQEEVDESNVEQNESQEDDENEANEHDENSQEEVDESNVEQNESQEDDENEANEHDENSQEEVDESNVEQNEIQEDDENVAVEEENEVQNESQLEVENDENEADEDTQEEVNESQNDDENEAVEDENQDEDDIVEDGNESENAELHYESASEEMEADDEPQHDQDDTPINQDDANTPEPADNEYNISHDTTGRNRNKHASPETILHNETKQSDSFSARRNTSIRKTKSVVNLLNDKPSLMPATDSVGFSDGTTNSSAEGSGWDSHRTTRKTIRQTFGRDATPRKSLRALVMEKSAKRHTLTSETAKFPLANSTAVPEISLGYLDINPIHQESTHEVSLRTRQLTLDGVLEKIKEDNLKKKAEIEESVKKSLETRSDDHIFKVPHRPMFPRRGTNQENKSNKVKPMWRGLPEEMIEDLQYKPPKRFKPSSAPWITKRLYKYLETKLEPKYDYKARVRAERLVETVYNFTKDLRRQTAASEDATNVLKHEMARLQIVRTHHEFYEFFRQFMPKEIRIKVIPDVVNKIPLPRRDVFSDIIVTDSAQG